MTVTEAKARARELGRRVAAERRQREEQAGMAELTSVLLAAHSDAETLYRVPRR